MQLSTVKRKPAFGSCPFKALLGFGAAEGHHHWGEYCPTVIMQKMSYKQWDTLLTASVYPVPSPDKSLVLYEMDPWCGKSSTAQFNNWTNKMSIQLASRDFSYMLKYSQPYKNIFTQMLINEWCMLQGIHTEKHFSIIKKNMIKKITDRQKGDIHLCTIIADFYIPQRGV